MSQNYIVATGNLGVAKTVEYEEYVNKRYVDLEYSMISNLHEYSVVIIDLQNENDTRHCLEDDEPDGIPYLFELSFPQKKFRPMISSFYGVCRRRYLPVQHQKSKEVQAVRKGLCYRQFLDCLFYAVYLVSVAFQVSLVLLGLRVFP